MKILKHVTDSIFSLEDKDIVIFGLGREGYSSYRFLRTYLPDISITLVDDQPLEKVAAHWSESLTNDPETHFVSSQDFDVTTLSQPLVFKTPGIPLHHPLNAQLQQKNISVTSNTQLFLELVNALQNDYPTINFVTIGVTGTKGKSTTTSAIAHVLKTAQKSSLMGGNIGTPALELLPQIEELIGDSEDDTVGENGGEEIFISLELSCHQLDLMTLSPHVAVVQNIVPEHLDYYGTFERYVAAKAHLTQFQTDKDIVVYCPEFETSRQLAELSPGKKYGFGVESSASNTNDGGHNLTCSLSNGHLLCKEIPIISESEVPLKGHFNLYNIFPSLVIGTLFGINVATLKQAIATFQPLEHRLELVAQKNGVEYYNDSLATVPEATLEALTSFPHKEIVLIAGGYDRGLEFSEFARQLTKHSIKALILFKPTGQKIHDELQKISTVESEALLSHLQFVKNMSEAVTLASQAATENSVVLMSPASASFGDFKDYKDRGDQFKAQVNLL